jgi:hypothetical protein
MVNGIISIFVCLFYILISWQKKYDFSLIRVYSLWNFLIICDYYFSQYLFVNYSDEIDLFFFVYINAFMIFYLLARLICRYNNYSIKIRLAKVSSGIFFVISIVLYIISVTLFFSALYRMGYTELREKMGSKEISFYIALSYPMCSASLFYININKMHTPYRNIFIWCVITLAIISTSKIFMVLSFLYIIKWYVPGYKIKLLEIVIIIIIGISGFFILHLLTNRIVGTGDNQFHKLLYTFNGYLLGGFASFNLYLDNKLEMYTTNGWIYTGTWIGNVIAGFRQIFQEHNYILLAIRSALLGLFYGFLFANRNKYIKYIKIYSFFPLLFIYFSDFFGSAVLQWITFAIATIALLFIKEPKTETI